MNSMDRNIIDVIENNKDTIGIDNCIRDLAVTYHTSYQQMSLYVQQLLGQRSNGSMSFKGNDTISSSYVEDRWKGKV